MTEVSALVAAHRDSQRLAIVVDGGPCLTYRQLFTAADELASRLGPSSASWWAITASDRLLHAVAVVGALVAGKPFIPDAADKRLPDWAGRAVEVSDATVSAALSAAQTNPASACAPGGRLRQDAGRRAPTAYAITTSGSTGAPTWVRVSRDNLAWHLAAWSSRTGLGPTDTVLHAAPLGFDVALEELLPTLAAGGSVVVPAHDFHPTPSALESVVRRHGITVVNLTSSIVARWMGTTVRRGQRLPESLRLVVAGSERLWWSTVADFRRCRRRGTALLNAYGLVETTITNLAYDTDDLPDDHAGPVPIGNPLPGVEVQIRTFAGGTDPAVGELVIRGRCVADVDAPGAARVGSAREYATGDLVERGPRGLTWIGRGDDQIKVRGIRVDLARVDQVVISSGLAAECVTRVSRSGSTLEVCIVPADISDAEAGSRLRHWLAGSGIDLPVIPTMVHVVESLPVGPTGKVTRRADVPTHPTQHVAGIRHGLAAQVAVAWNAVLGRVGQPDRFVGDGGDSLAAIELITRLEDIIGSVLPPDLLDRHPSFDELVEALTTVTGMGPHEGEADQLTLHQRTLLRVGADAPPHAYENCIFVPASSADATSAAGLRSQLGSIAGRLTFAADPSATRYEQLEAASCNGECRSWVPDRPLTLDGALLRLWWHDVCGSGHVTLQSHHVLLDAHSMELLADSILDGVPGDLRTMHDAGPRARETISALAMAEQLRGFQLAGPWLRDPGPEVANWGPTASLKLDRKPSRSATRDRAASAGATEFCAVLHAFALSAARFTEVPRFAVSHSIDLRTPRADGELGTFTGSRLTVHARATAESPPNHDAVDQIRGITRQLAQSRTGVPGELVAWSLRQRFLDGLKLNYEVAPDLEPPARFAWLTGHVPTRRDLSVSVVVHPRHYALSANYRADRLAETFVRQVLELFVDYLEAPA